MSGTYKTVNVAASDPVSLDAINLPPFGVYIGQVQ